MNTRLVNSAAGVVLAAMEQDRTAAGIALALESAQLLMSPETAAELAGLRARLADVHRMPQDNLTPAEVRLAQYGERAKTWSTATHDSGAEKALYEIACALRDTLEETRDQRNAARLKVLGLESRVSALLAERHSTNESVDDAAKALRANRDRIAELEQQAQVEAKLRPHREMVSNSNLHYIGKLELRIRRARTLHLNHPDRDRCQHDGEAWPCPTVAALEAAVGEAVYPCGCPKRFGRHAEGCPTEGDRAAEVATGDTFPAWLYQRFMPDGEGWDRLDSGQREYWEHQARAVRRAVERDGFKEPSQAAPKCRCDEPGADQYACEADPEDCSGHFSELSPFGGAGPVEGRDAKVSRRCGRCGWDTSVWHVDDGSAEEELHGHVVRVHGGVLQEWGESS